KAQMNRDFQRVASRKVFSLTTAEVEARDPKEFISRITTDTGFVSDFLIDLLVMEIPRLYFLISTMIKVFRMGSGTLVLGFVAVIPVILLGSFWSGRVTYQAQNRLQSALASLTARLAEKVEHPEIIKAYNKTEDEIADGEVCIDQMRKAQKKAALAAAFNQLIANILFIVPTLIIMLFAAVPLLMGQISVALYITYIGLGATYQKYIADHLTLWVLAKKAQGATVRISGILLLDEDRGGPEKAEKTGALCFENVSFSLDGKKVLDNVSFTVREGSKFAVVGESGSGKSTLLSLIEQFYRPGEGRITLGGVNIQDYEISGYRALFSYLPQNAPGFSGTVRDLLTYGSRRSHSDEELRDMLHKVGMLGNIEEMGGLDYEVGQNASRLSGGQRQRLAVARMLLSDARIVLADEATSALDIHGTQTVAKLIDEYAKGKTRILVSHDLSTVIDADAILVLDHGRVAGFGTHEELLRSCPQYAVLLLAGEEVAR
ncbi:MAG: ABC transporter ATP-binding protein, partial [Erysipelotrichaceae bacterium]|nr:ABC transporter ATP-binding protein [Erysipelotrichaceae bacterium]